MQTIVKNLKIINKEENSVIVYLLNIVDSPINKSTTIYGLDMSGWVKQALNNVPYIELDYDNSDLVEFLKSKMVNSKYSIVLFSNTPLITNPSILKIMEYVTIKDINACKFSGGFAFKNDYLLNTKQVQFDAVLPLDEEEFLVVNNASKLKFATSILHDRIIQKHINNGVEILGNSDIDELVEIGKACMIFNGNVIKGNTTISDNTILKENNIIDNCVIGQDVCIAGSNLTNSTVEDNVFILPYCYINNATIRKNCYISSNETVENRTLRAGTRLPKEKK